MFSPFTKSHARYLASMPLSSGISILSLSLGIVCTIFISLYVQDELAYDKGWRNAGSIVRIDATNRVVSTGEEIVTDSSPAPVAALLQSSYSSVDFASRLKSLEFLVSHEENRFYETIHLADPEFLEIFDFKFIQGDSQSALRGPNSLLITESVARRYFGTLNVLNRLLILDNKEVYRVSAVVEDLRDNTHLNIEFLTNLVVFEAGRSDRRLEQWYYTLTTYLFMDNKDITSETLTELNSFLVSHEPPQGNITRTYSLVEIDQLRKLETRFTVVQIVPLVILIGCFIFALSCVNYVNITLKNSLEKSRELAIHKVLGALRSRLAFEVIFQSIFQSLVALLISMLIVVLVLPFFNSLTTKQISMELFIDAYVVLSLVSLIFITAVLSGGYPAYILSFSKIIDLLKSKIGSAKNTTTELLIIFQYTVAISLSIITIFVVLQLDYLRKMDMGFNRENIVVIDNFNFSALKSSYEEFRVSLLRSPSIVSVTRSQAVPAKEFDRVLVNVAKVGSSPHSGVILNFMMNDYDFFETYGIELIAGRVFNRTMSSDLIKFGSTDSRGTYGAVINETAARTLGWNEPREAIGELITHGIAQWRFDFRIIGVVQNIDILAGHGTVKPYIYLLNPVATNYVSVALNSENVSTGINTIAEIWHKVYPDFPIEREFLDDQIDSSYLRLNRIQSVIKILTLVSITIALIGSFALSAASIRNRNREISMRKILGSSTLGIINLLSWDFGKLVVVANLISWAIASLVVESFLSSFNSRIDLGLVVFISVFMASLALVFSTTWIHTLKVIRTNPVETFRHE